MLVVKKGYKRVYAYGGSGIFDTIGSFLSKLASNTVVRQLASTAAKELGNVAIDTGKKLAEKGISKLMTTKPDLNRQVLDIANKYSASNINSQIDGGTNAIAIQNLVRKLNGAGMKFA